MYLRLAEHSIGMGLWPGPEGSYLIISNSQNTVFSIGAY